MDTSQELDSFILLLAESSKILVEAGCSSNRLERLLSELGDTWGYHVESFALPTGVSLMVSRGGQRSVTLTRIRRWQLDLDRIQRINDMIGEFSAKNIDVNKARDLLQEVANSPAPYPPWMTVGAGGGASAGLVYLLGGGLLEVMLAFITGALVSVMQKSFFVGESRRYLADFLSAFAVSSITSLVVTFAPSLQLNEHRIVTGGIIVLIPGLVFVNAIHEIALKNLVSGAAKTFEAIIIALSLSFGIASGSALVGFLAP